jgi:hypothetical protein
MREGWCGDEYIVLFEERAPALQTAYGITSALPGYRLLGLRGWDDFIVEDSSGGRLIVPTVPLLPSLMGPFTITVTSELEPDERVRDRIKWYVKPIVFGGDPRLDENVIWISVDQHTQLVTWWNAKYRELRPDDS